MTMELRIIGFKSVFLVHFFIFIKKKSLNKLFEKIQLLFASKRFNTIIKPKI